MFFFVCVYLNAKQLFILVRFDYCAMYHFFFKVALLLLFFLCVCTYVDVVAAAIIVLSSFI